MTNTCPQSRRQGPKSKIQSSAPRACDFGLWTLGLARGVRNPGLVKGWSRKRGLAFSLWVCFGLAIGFARTASAAATNTSLPPKVPGQKAAEAKAETPDAKHQTGDLPQSVFVVPKSRLEGVDPFFPRSVRLEAVDLSDPNNKPKAVGELVIKGFSGTAAAPLIIINDSTFGVGDEKDVVTNLGRARVRCIEIRLRDRSAIIEANGERRELRFRNDR